MQNMTQEQHDKITTTIASLGFPRAIRAKYSGICSWSGVRFQRGEEIRYFTLPGEDTTVTVYNKMMGYISLTDVEKAKARFRQFNLVEAISFLEYPEGFHNITRPTVSLFKADGTKLTLSRFNDRYLYNGKVASLKNIERWTQRATFMIFSCL